jgi:hypothetical protein
LLVPRLLGLLAQEGGHVLNRRAGGVAKLARLSRAILYEDGGTWTGGWRDVCLQNLKTRCPSLSILSTRCMTLQRDSSTPICFPTMGFLLDGPSRGWIITLLILVASLGKGESATCAPYPISARVGNITLSNGQISRGVAYSVGTPAQDFSFLPQWYVALLSLD